MISLIFIEGESSEEAVDVVGGADGGEVKEYTQMSGVTSLQDVSASNVNRNAQQVRFDDGILFGLKR